MKPALIHKMSAAAAAHYQPGGKYGPKAPRPLTAAQLIKQKKREQEEAEEEELQDELADLTTKKYKKMKSRLDALEEINRQLIEKLRER